MSLVFSFLKKYRTASLLALLMMVIELTVELAQPYLISKIIDDGIVNSDLGVVWMWGAVLVGGSIVAFGAGVASSFLASFASQGFASDLRETLYDKVQSFSYSVFSRFATSSLITRMTGDVTMLQDTVFMSLRFMTRVPLVVIGSVVMAMIVNFKLGLLLALTVPLLLVFVMWIMRRAGGMFKNVQRRLDKVNSVIQENLTGIRLIRVFVRMKHENNRFAASSGKLMKNTVSALRLTETTMPFIMLVMNAAIVAVLWFGRADIAAGGASVGEVVAVANYALRTIGALSAFSWIAVTFSRAGASAQRVSEVLDTQSGEFEQKNAFGRESGASAAAFAEAKDAEERQIFGQASLSAAEAAETSAPSGGASIIQGTVEFQHVSFKYPTSDIKVLEDISFKIEAGKRIAIMGATGSGKSSLVQLIPHLYDRDKGGILIDGRSIDEWDTNLLRRSIGYVPQEVLLFTGSIRENIAWGREDATLEEIMQAARIAQIHDTVEKLPNGYNTQLGQRGVNLSGGQKQRLSIARALVRRPSILILDDSTSALDLATEARLLGALEDISCTTFLITQKISSTEAADLILLLDEGRLIESGTHHELMKNSKLYRHIYESQSEKGEALHA
ncbi:ABC transporter ATP-binding protein [Saccharibacillus kuerlensis]|uniref:ABC transporter ATP-binding protein YfiB n=1 Tax=Saccharibacillus kuerlensis TaxID=459527 RepID=A0ABQ2L045_9BACL|nr:ABC transporter ATP-binding protein [Saccharibacillus kuerlensis]GGN98071.1 putative ABC transporter ATP-binding protein YfiB [Saccharibacillus kuerlensis]